MVPARSSPWAARAGISGMWDIVLRLLYALRILITVLSYVLIARALLSWFIPRTNRLMQVLDRLTEPAVRPFRPLAMKLAMRMRGGIMIDFAPLFAYFVLQILSALLTQGMWWIQSNMLF